MTNKKIDIDVSPERFEDSPEEDRAEIDEGATEDVATADAQAVEAVVESKKLRQIAS